jgi:hypothetical protein
VHGDLRRAAHLSAGEDKRDFLDRARDAVIACARAPERPAAAGRAAQLGAVDDQQVALLFVALFGALAVLAVARCWSLTLRDEEGARAREALRREPARAVDRRAGVLGLAWVGARGRDAAVRRESPSWRCASSSRWCTPGAATTAA